MKSASRLTRGYLIAFLSAAVLSTTAIFIRYLTQRFHLPPLVLAFWRDSFVALTLLPVLALLDSGLLRITRAQIRYLLLYGLVLSLFNAIWTLSVALNGAAVSTVLVYCSAAFTSLLGWWLLNERLDGTRWLAIAIVLAGCALVSGALNLEASALNIYGILTGVLSGLCYAGYSLMGRSASQRGLNPWTTLFFTFAFAAGFLFFFNLVVGVGAPGAAAGGTGLLWLGQAWDGWGILFLLAAGPTLLGFGLYNTSLTHLPSGLANLIVTSEPVFTTVIAYALLGERLTAIQIVGSVLILGGVALTRVLPEVTGRRSESRQPAGIDAPLT